MLYSLYNLVSGEIEQAFFYVYAGLCLSETSVQCCFHVYKHRGLLSPGGASNSSFHSYHMIKIKYFENLPKLGKDFVMKYSRAYKMFCFDWKQMFCFTS